MASILVNQIQNGMDALLVKECVTKLKGAQDVQLVFLQTMLDRGTQCTVHLRASWYIASRFALSCIT